MHCLNILRIIIDDTILKPYTKDFYDHIILNIVDGLGGDNWTIKNACMLLFSKLNKNSFGLDKNVEKDIPTFIGYFTNKNVLKNKIFDILNKEANKLSNECNDCLILLISFFEKLKPSKPSEINEIDLNKFIEVLFKLSPKNNKIFRKTLGKVIVSFYNENQGLCYDRVLEYFESIKGNIQQLRVSNSEFEQINLNSLDFHINLINELKVSQKYRELTKFIGKNIPQDSAEDSNYSSQNSADIVLRKIENKVNLEGLQLMKLDLFIKGFEKIILEIYDEIKKIIENDKNKDKDGLLSQSNSFNIEEFSRNYIYSKEKKNKNFINTILLISKKLYKFLTKMNEVTIQYQNNKKIIFENIFNALADSFNLKLDDSDEITNIFLGKIKYIKNDHSNHVLGLSYDQIDYILKLNSRNPFYYKTLRNYLKFIEFKNNVIGNKNNILVEGFNLDKVNNKNQEFTLFLMKNFKNSILIKDKINEYTVICINNFKKKNQVEINVSIFSKILDFYNANIELIETDFHDDCNLLLKILSFIGENINVTKLIKPLLISIGKLLRKICDHNILKNASIETNVKIYDMISKQLEIVQSLTYAANEEKIRFASLNSLENLVEYIHIYSQKINKGNIFELLVSTEQIDMSHSNLLKLLLIFVHVLNDEHPEIRNYGVKIFNEFNTFCNILAFNNFEKLRITDYMYSSEFLFKKLMKFENFFDKAHHLMKNAFLTDLKIEFFKNIYKNNFYFSKSRLILNNQNKIFYYEPDNRYLDNIEITLILYNQLLKIETRNKILFEKYQELLKTTLNSKRFSTLKIMDLLENFIFHFTDNFETIYIQIKDEIVKSNRLNAKIDILNEIRNIIY